MRPRPTERKLQGDIGCTFEILKCVWTQGGGGNLTGFGGVSVVAGNHGMVEKGLKAGLHRDPAVFLRTLLSIPSPFRFNADNTRRLHINMNTNKH